MKETTKINDLFIVYADETLIADYRKILIDLYQPFVGATAIAMYDLLNKFADNNQTFSFHKLVIGMNCNFDTLPDLFAKLEATNLVTTYEGEVDGFTVLVYQLNSPLSVYQFLKDPTLVQVLTSYIGTDAVTEIKEQEQKRTQYLEQIKNLKNISHLLKDVYREELLGRSSFQEVTMSEYDGDSILTTGQYDFDTFLIMLPTSVRLNYEFNQNIKKLLFKLADMYNLDSKEMAVIFNMSLQRNQGNITEENIRKEAYEYMVKTLRNENEQSRQQDVREMTSTNTNVDRSVKNDAVQQALMQMKKLSTFDYVKMITDSLTPQDYKNVEKLIIDYGLEQEVANVLINYVYHDKHTLSLPLMEAIAQGWHKRKIKTAEEAYLALRENNQKSKQAAKKPTRTFEKRTERVSNFDDQIVETDEATIEELFKKLGE